MIEIVTTLREYTASKLGVSQIAPVACPCCKVPVAPFAITKDVQNRWRCGHCRIDEERNAQAAVNPGNVLGMNDIRGRRNLMLVASDSAVVPDRPMLNRPEWETWRQKLRDVTKGGGTPLQMWQALDALESQKPGGL